MFVRFSTSDAAAALALFLASFFIYSQGKVVYATNVASQWGLTQREYERFAALGEKYDDSQLQILAFPSQEFGGQEFGSDEEIAAFAAGQNFPGILLQLGSVVGDTAPGVWKHLRDATDSSDPGWNFDSKYLVSKTGEVSVPTADVEDDVEKLIGE